MKGSIRFLEALKNKAEMDNVAGHDAPSISFFVCTAPTTDGAFAQMGIFMELDAADLEYFKNKAIRGVEAELKEQQEAYDKKSVEASKKANELVRFHIND